MASKNTFFGPLLILVEKFYYTAKTSHAYKIVPNSLDVRGVESQATLQDLQALKARHNIEASQILKGALGVIVNQRTGQSEALLGQIQAGRTWPFMLEWPACSMPPALDVAGRTTYLTISRLEIQKKEKVMDMLLRLRDQQRLLNRHG
jgi:hypothetical protein